MSIEMCNIGVTDFLEFILVLAGGLTNGSGFLLNFANDHKLCSV